MITCEACGHQVEGLTCPDCSAENPLDAKYCAYCGQPLTGQSAESPLSPGDDPYDLKNRILCSDDNCIGIINEKGVCTECGKPYSSASH